MKKLLIAFIIFSFAAGMGFAADPVEGYWMSVDEKTGKVTAAWHVYQEGGKLFGKIMSLPDDPPTVLADKCKDSYSGFPLPGKVSQMKVVGTPWIFSLTLDKPNQPGVWSGGNIIDPNDGNMYKCKITFRAAGTKSGSRTFQADTLEMRGEIGLGIGRSQFWNKTDQATASSLYKK